MSDWFAAWPLSVTTAWLSTWTSTAKVFSGTAVAILPRTSASIALASSSDGRTRFIEPHAMLKRTMNAARTASLRCMWVFLRRAEGATVVPVNDRACGALPARSTFLQLGAYECRRARRRRPATCATGAPELAVDFCEAPRDGGLEIAEIERLGQDVADVGGQFGPDTWDRCSDDDDAAERSGVTMAQVLEDFDAAY